MKNVYYKCMQTLRSGKKKIIIKPKKEKSISIIKIKAIVRRKTIDYMPQCMPLFWNNVCDWHKKHTVSQHSHITL